MNSETDLEVKARLFAVIRHMAEREADRLFQKGRLEESLRYEAQAWGSSNPDDSVARMKRAVVTEIALWLPQNPWMGDESTDYAALARRIAESFGPWGIAVLLDALILKSSSEGIPAGELLEEMGLEALPCLARVLECSNPELQREVCLILYSMIAHHATPLEESPAVCTVLHGIAIDPTADETTRTWSRRILERIRGRRMRAVRIPFQGMISREPPSTPKVGRHAGDPSKQPPTLTS